MLFEAFRVSTFGIKSEKQFVKKSSDDMLKKWLENYFTKELSFVVVTLKIKIGIYIVY